MLQKLVGGLIFSGILFSQTTANPQFSVIGDLVMDQINDSPKLSSSGVEIAIQGNVNPFARADIYLHKHNDESPIELEEAVLTIERGLPLGLGLRLGKFRPDLGRINKVHAHLFPFIEAPTGMKKVLGEEFWAPTGVEANILLPLPWYSNVSVGYFDSGIRGDIHEGEGESHDLEQNHDHNHGEEKQDFALSGRWSHFFDLNDINHIEIGTSGYLGDKNILIGADLKYKWRPNKYKSLTLEVEIFQYACWDDGPEDLYQNNCTGTYYGMVNYQFNKSYNIGVIGEVWVHQEEDEISPALFIGYSPVEESAVFRLKIGQVNHFYLPGEDKIKQDLIVTAQLIWSLGPHKPHRY